MSRQGRETITVIPQSGEDKFGDRTQGTPFDVPGCAILPRTSAELNGTEVVVAGLDVYAPGGTAIDASALVIARGETYAVDGEVADYVDGTRSEAVRVVLKKVGETGA